MAERFESLKKAIVALSFMLNPLAVIKTVKILADMGFIDPNVSLEDLARSVNMSRKAVTRVICALMKYGVLARTCPHLYSITDRESTLRALEQLEAYFSDKVVIPDYLTLYYLEEEPLSLLLEYGRVRTYFFAAKGSRIFKPRNIAVETINSDGVKYYVVTREALNNVDRILAVELKALSRARRTHKGAAIHYLYIYVGYKWIDPQSIGAQKLYFDEYGIAGDGVVQISVKDLLEHEFDLDRSELIYIDFDSVYWCRGDIEPLLGKLFYTEEHRHLMPGMHSRRHFKVSLLLQEIGSCLGFESFTEYMPGPGRRYDVAYFKDKDLVAVFEIVVTGNYSDALLRLSEANAKVKFLVASRRLLSRITERLPPGVKVIELELVEEALRSRKALVTLIDEIKNAVLFN